ncbi:MAG: putative DCC family thiol-disulfide oxidoreductase YuxK [Patescibacteria group bacterium]|jgi:predicted DCC family thiol-disulfide oxidoreductase YuxK
MAQPHPILLFDGVCNLCNQSVQFVIRKDPAGLIHFAALQSEQGKALLQKHKLSPDSLDTVVLVMNGKAYTRSSAALQVLRLLGLPWSLLSVFLFLPKGFRDFVYNYIAKNRYRWFGREESCMMPSPDLKNRFLN